MLSERTEVPELPYGMGVQLDGMGWGLLTETRWEAEPGLVTTIKDCRSGQEVYVKIHTGDVKEAIAWQDSLVNGLLAINDQCKKNPPLLEFLRLVLKGDIQLVLDRAELEP